MGSAAGPGGDKRFARPHRPRVADRQRRRGQPLKREDEPKSCRLIDAQRVRGDTPAVVGGQRHLLGFGDQVADGQHQSVGPDDDAVAKAFGSQPLGRERVLGDLGLQGDDRRQAMIQIETKGTGDGAKRLVDLVAGEWRGHRSTSAKAIGDSMLRRPAALITP